MKFIIGKKVEMTERFREDGRSVPVTILQAGPCTVTQVKNVKKDGYDGVQIGFGLKKKLTKPMKGHLKGIGDFRTLREFRLAAPVTLKQKDSITVQGFAVGDRVTVVGTSKGKGFQGVVRRHGFHGGPATHGDKDQHRMPGSIGATDNQRVRKGRHMAGQMGDERITVKDLEVIEIDAERNLLYVKGAVPGARNGILLISGDGEMKPTVQEAEKPTSEVEPTPDAKPAASEPAVETGAKKIKNAQTK